MSLRIIMGVFMSVFMCFNTINHYYVFIQVYAYVLPYSDAIDSLN